MKWNAFFKSRLHGAWRWSWLTLYLHYDHLCHFWTLVIKTIRTVLLPKKYTRNEKKFPDKIDYLKKISKFTSEHVLIRPVVLVLIVKIVIKNEKLYFVHEIYARFEKNVGKVNFSFQKDLQISFWLFFHKSYIFSFIHWKSFSENQKFNFAAKIYKIHIFPEHEATTSTQFQSANEM